MSDILTPAELQSTYGGSGTHDPDNVQLAIDLAEFDIADALDTALIPTTFTEEYMWPWDGSSIMLGKRKVTSITTVTAKHSLDADCVWTEDAECGVILNGEHGIVRLVGCSLSLGDCDCDVSIVPDRAVITYVAGFTVAETAAGTALGKALRMAIALRAREWIQALELNDYWEGEKAVTSWSSMDYSEQSELVDVMNPLGPGPLSRAAWNILERMIPKTAVVVRGSGRY